MGAFLGRLVYFCSPRYRMRVLDNLAASGLAPSSDDVRRLAKANAAEIGKGATELVWALFRPIDEVAATVVDRVGWEAVEKLRAAGRAILFDADEVPILAGPGKGVLGLRLAPSDRIVGAALFGDDEKRAVLKLENSKGTAMTVTRRYTVVGRGGKGFELTKRERIVRVVPEEIELVDLPELPEKV